MKYKEGQKVLMRTSEGGFYYKLHWDDVVAIEEGAWHEWGWIILPDSEQKASIIKEVYECFKFGLLPYWCYEKAKHYECSYWRHLITNMRYAWGLIWN